LVARRRTCRASHRQPFGGIQKNLEVSAEKDLTGSIEGLPTAAAGKKEVGNKRIAPGGWEQRTGQRLRFVYRRGQLSLLVAETRLNSRGRAVVSRSKTGRGLATVPIFILVPQVKLPKRLSLEGPARKAEARLPRLIVANWLAVQT
jgi:hypothetical protein